MRKITRRELKKRIKNRYLSGKPLNISAVKRECPELIDAAFNCKPFLGWYQAVTDAGVDYRDIKIELQERIICRFCGKACRNLANHLSMKHKIKFKEYRVDYPEDPGVSEELLAKKTVFSNRNDLLIPHWEPIWTDEYVLDRLAAVYRHGFPLNHSFIEDSENDFYLQIMRRFGSYDNALKRIGLQPDRIRKRTTYNKWNKELIVDELKQLYENGQDISPVAMIKHHYRLYCSVGYWFKNYTHALKTAGINPVKVYRVNPAKSISEKKMFLKALKQFAKTKKSYDPDVVIEFKKQHKSDISRWYNRCWGNACKDAGVSNRHPVNQKLRVYPDRASVIAAIKKRKKLGLPLIGVANREERDEVLYDSGAEYFGSWKNALKSAGLDPGEVYIMESRRMPPERRPFLQLIKQFAKTKESYDPYTLWKFKKEHNDKVLRWYRGWTRACNNAGVPENHPLRKRQRIYPDRASVIAAIKKRKKLGLPQTRNDILFRKHKNTSLYRRSIEFFGSWQNALKAAKV